MADQLMNIARGSIAEKVRDGADVIVILLKATEVDDTLNNYDDLAALLAAAGNTEADFTNYERKIVLNAALTLTVDDATNAVQVEIGDQVYTAAGGATNNSLVKMIVCTDGATDADRVPLTHHDLTVTTDGSDLTLQEPATGFYGSP